MAMESTIRRIQDAVHGLMEFRGLETIVIELLRTPELQRLRRIRQLGMAHQVFPGAEHSRLAHGLGASFVSVRFARQLAQDRSSPVAEILRPGAEAVRDLAVAALCHDLGHGPLSHAWERVVVREPYDAAQWIDSLGLDSSDIALSKLKWHELVGQGLLAFSLGDLHRLLEQHEEGFTLRLRLLLMGRYFPEYLPRLLSSDVDADRADYLLRDAHYCGVNYGRYDLDWLVSTSMVGRAPHGDGHVVGFDARKAPRVVEQFLTARAAMYDTVYCHKTVRSVEGMMGLFLRRLRDVGLPATGALA